MYKNIAIIGSSGAIGGALLKQISVLCPEAKINAFARAPEQISIGHIRYHRIDYSDEASIAHASSVSSENEPLDLVIVATGVLHDGTLQPEKSLRDLSADKFEKIFSANTILPALIAKHFIPKIEKEKRAVFAVLSARVGSISDNNLGGWYAYRASKCALNMIIKNAAIETRIRSKKMIIVSLHPGTVDTPLSEPFHKNIKKENIFTPSYASEKLLSVINTLTPEDSGKFFAWNGEEILP